MSNELSNYRGANGQPRLDDPGSFGAPAPSGCRRRRSSTSRTDRSPSSPRSKTQTATPRASWSPLGGETGGFAFLVLDSKPTFIYSWLGLEKYTIASSEPLPTGSCTIRFDFDFDFAYDGGGAGKGGTGTLSVSEKTVAPRAGSRKRSPSTSRPTTRSMWGRTGGHQCRRATGRPSPSPAHSRR